MFTRAASVGGTPPKLAGGVRFGSSTRKFRSATLAALDSIAQQPRHWVGNGFCNVFLFLLFRIGVKGTR